MNEPPYSEEAEVCLLGALTLDANQLAEVRHIAKPEDFYLERYRTVYRAIIDLDNDGKPFDPVSIFDRLGSEGGMDGALADIMSATATAAYARRHAQIIRDKARLRKLILACNETAREATANGKDPSEIIQAAEERLLGTTEQGRVSEWVGASESVMEAMEYLEEAQKAPDGIIGLRTGFPWLDHITGGLREGDLTILAARPAMGKSALAWNVSRNIALKGNGVALASYEMSRARLLHRGIASETGIDSHRLRTGGLEQREWSKVADAANRLGKLPIVIQYPPATTVEGLRSDFRRLLRKQRANILVVDYLQQMSGRGENRNNQVEHISRNLKRIATDFGVHVLALAQLSRGVEHRKPPRPMLSDLRDSGAIEQDADNVLLLWRPEEYFDEATPDEQRAKWTAKAEIIMAKQRDGETGRCVLRWNGPTTTFTEPTEEKERFR